jgi:hypothetical protein
MCVRSRSFLVTGKEANGAIMNHLRRLVASRRLRVIAVIVVLLIIAFEIGIRVLPPNSMNFTETDPNGRVVVSYSSDDATTVRRWYHYVNSQHSLGF